jgi:hypothetical protein
MIKSKAYRAHAVKHVALELSERNRNVLRLVELEMSAGQSFRFSRNPRRQG